MVVSHIIVIYSKPFVAKPRISNNVINGTILSVSQNFSLHRHTEFNRLMSVYWNNIVHADSLNWNKIASLNIESESMGHKPYHRISSNKILTDSSQQVYNTMIILDLWFIWL